MGRCICNVEKPKSCQEVGHDVWSHDPRVNRVGIVADPRPDRRCRTGGAAGRGSANHPTLHHSARRAGHSGDDRAGALWWIPAGGRFQVAADDVYRRGNPGGFPRAAGRPTAWAGGCGAGHCQRAGEAGTGDAGQPEKAGTRCQRHHSGDPSPGRTQLGRPRPANPDRCHGSDALGGVYLPLPGSRRDRPQRGSLRPGVPSGALVSNWLLPSPPGHALVPAGPHQPCPSVNGHFSAATGF